MTFHALIFLDFEPNLDHSCSDLQICIQGSPHFCIFIFHVCWHFDKGATSNIDNILHDHDGLPQVPLLTVHLEMVLISVNSSSMCAGILIKVQQAILITFSMIMLSSPMSPSRCPPGNGPHVHEFIFHVCWHFDKGATSNIDDILHDHVELPHVPHLAVHLVMVLRMVSEVPSVAHKSKSHH